jgi:hypothetical protein
MSEEQDEVEEAGQKHVPTQAKQDALPGALLYEPAAQAEHRGAPGGEELPGAHASHVALEFAPRTEEAVPAAHSVQFGAFTKGLKDPARQSRHPLVPKKEPGGQGGSPTANAPVPPDAYATPLPPIDAELTLLPDGTGTSQTTVLRRLTATSVPADVATMMFEEPSTTGEEMIAD